MDAHHRRMLLFENSYLRNYLLKKRLRGRKITNSIYLERPIHGEFHRLYPQLRRNPASFKQYSQVSPETFDYIVEAIKPALKFQNTNFQIAISTEERLMVTLRYLVTGIQFRRHALAFRISKTAISRIIHQVCKAIWDTLLDKHMPEPTEHDLMKNAEDFWTKWQFPHCMGSIDGKHIRLKNKSFFSVGLMAIADANYKFVMVHVGSYGERNDAGFFDELPFKHAIETGKMKLPDESFLPGSNLKAPYVFVAGANLPLKEYLMRPYPLRKTAKDNEKDNYNHRLSRARIVAEFSFGAIATKFRVLLKPMDTSADNAIHIVKAITMLYNVIHDMENENEQYQGAYQNLTRDNVQMRYNASSKAAMQVREKFNQFFNQHPI